MSTCVWLAGSRGTAEIRHIVALTTLKVARNHFMNPQIRSCMTSYLDILRGGDPINRLECTCAIALSLSLDLPPLPSLPPPPPIHRSVKLCACSFITETHVASRRRERERGANKAIWALLLPPYYSGPDCSQSRLCVIAHPPAPTKLEMEINGAARSSTSSRV